MILVLLLALAYGTPNWGFPWWVWTLATLLSVGTIAANYEERRARKDQAYGNLLRK